MKINRRNTMWAAAATSMALVAAACGGDSGSGEQAETAGTVGSEVQSG